MLKPQLPLVPGSTPRFLENPFAPKGHEIEIIWDKTPEPPFAQRVHDGGKTSGKLFRCGLSWRHVTYYDEQMRPLSFPYGYALKRPIADKDENAAAFAEYQIEEFLDKHPELFVDDPPVPVSTDPLEAERERDRARRKHRQKDRLKDLVNTNYLNYMYTFTFALELNKKVHGLRFILPEAEQRDRIAVEKAWNKRRSVIAEKLRQRGVAFRFVKVLERHDSEDTDPRKRLTFHIHLATDRRLSKRLLQELWGYGVVWIDNFNKSKVKNTEGRTINVERDGCVISPGDYMAKYLDKDFEEADALGKRAYSPSQGLTQPPVDKDTDTRQHHLTQPATGFSDFDKVHIEAVEPGLFAKIEALADIEQVKVFDKVFAVEIQRISQDTGEPEPVKMFVRYELYNFRLLMNNARWEKRLGGAYRVTELMFFPFRPSRREKHSVSHAEKSPL